MAGSVIVSVSSRLSSVGRAPLPGSVIRLQCWTCRSSCERSEVDALAERDRDQRRHQVRVMAAQPGQHVLFAQPRTHIGDRRVLGGGVNQGADVAGEQPQRRRTQDRWADRAPTKRSGKPNFRSEVRLDESEQVDLSRQTRGLVKTLRQSWMLRMSVSAEAQHPLRKPQFVSSTAKSNPRRTPIRHLSPLGGLGCRLPRRRDRHCRGGEVINWRLSEVFATPGV